MPRMLRFSLIAALAASILAACARPEAPATPGPTPVPTPTSQLHPVPTAPPTPTLLPRPTPAPGFKITPLTPSQTPWQKLTEYGSPGFKLLTSHATEPGWIYAVTGGNGELIVSHNGGSTWQSGDLSRIDLIKVAPTDPMVVYAIAQHRASLWKSTNGGLNFDRLKAPLGEHFSLAVSPSNAHSVYLVEGSGIGDIPGGRELYRSDDGGETWVSLAHLPANMGFKGDLVIDPTDGAHLYATLWGQSVGETKAYESWDGGVTWGESELLKYFAPMKWIVTKGQSPTAYVAVRSEPSDGQVPSYAAARPRSVKFRLAGGGPVEVFPGEGFPEFREFMVLDAMFSNPQIVVGRYLGGNYGGAILLTQDGGESWLRLDTAGWGAGSVLYPMALVKDLALASTNPLRVFAGVHWPPELQGLWMLELRLPSEEST